MTRKTISVGHGHHGLYHVVTKGRYGEKKSRTGHRIPIVLRMERSVLSESEKRGRRCAGRGSRSGGEGIEHYCPTSTARTKVVIIGK